MQCPSCSRRNREDARFCDGCGHPLAAPPDQPATPREEVLDAGVRPAATAGQGALVMVVGGSVSGRRSR
jgi:hypothetical protein